MGNVGYGTEKANQIETQCPVDLRDSSERSGLEQLGSLGDAEGFAVMIASPKAGVGDGGKMVQALASELRSCGWQSAIFTDIEAAQRAIENLPAEVVNRCVLVAAGGDGTLNLVVSRFPGAIPIVPMPLGTENLVAQHFGLTSGRKMPSLSRIVKTVIAGTDITIDSGLATFPRARRGRGEARRFLIMATTGLDAEVVRRMQFWRRGHISRWSYFKPILAVLRRYSYPRISVYREDAGAVSGEGSQWESSPWLTVGWGMVFNLPRYGGGFRIEPAADGQDGLLDFCGFKGGGHSSTLRYLVGITWRQHHRFGDVVRARGARFRFESSMPVAVQLDGDYVGKLPVEIEICPLSVKLRVPGGE